MRALTGGRKVATAMVTSSLILLIALMGVAFFGPMKNSVTKLSGQLPHYWERLQKPLIKIEKQAVLAEEKLQAEVAVEIAHTSTNAPPKGEAPKKSVAPPPDPHPKEPVSLRTGLNHFFQPVFSSFSSVAFNAAQILVVLVTVFFGVTFTLMDPRPVFSAIFMVIPVRHHEQTVIIMQRIGKFVPTWAFATLLAMLTVGLLVFLLMWPFFGFMEALILGLIAGVFEAIPYLGPILSAVPALLFALGQGGLTPVWVLLAYLAVQLVENNVISPLIMARSMKLHSVAVIFSMLLCVAAFGVLGVLVAAPLVAIVGILHDELYRKRILPQLTGQDLDRLARRSLREKVSVPE
jgi:predicted PurR-regulated permease PerM